ncbi:MAG: hypothetical protein ABEJ76_01200 [Halanaeroarchaeum sp.]
MIVRVVLAVLVAAALIAAAAPAIGDARDGVATADVQREAHEVADAVATLSRRNDPVPRGVPGSRRILTVDPPSGTRVGIGGVPSAKPADGDGTDVVSWVSRSGATGLERLPVDARAVGSRGVLADDRGIVIRERSRLRLAYVLVDGEPTVTLTRV